MAPFRAVIVGGGPVGLAAGHALGLAGIDYVILERRDTVADPTNGANLAMWPHAMRILDQFGLLEETRQIGVPMKYKLSLDANGAEISRSNMFEVVEQNHGHPWVLFHRARLLEMLHQRLPEKETRIKTSKDVTRVETLPDGVRVHCSDGTIEEGSIVIGCDGVHSRIRIMMREMALAAGAKITDPELPMKSEYMGLVSYIPDILKCSPKVAPETIYETREKDYSLTLLRRKTDAYFVVYKLMETPTYERRKYDDKDVQEFIDKIWDHGVGEGYRVRDIWPHTVSRRIVNLEEGSLKTWHWDRIVLAGDAVCKMTPNSGLGLNNGLQGIVALTNSLRAVLKDNAEPSTEALDRAFASYQTARLADANQALTFSGLYSRVVAWPSIIYRIMCFVAPYLGGDVVLLNLLASPIVKKGLVLDFVEEKGFKEGKVPWIHKALKGVEEQT